MCEHLVFCAVKNCHFCDVSCFTSRSFAVSLCLDLIMVVAKLCGVGGNSLTGKSFLNNILISYCTPCNWIQEIFILEYNKYKYTFIN